MNEHKNHLILFVTNFTNHAPPIDKSKGYKSIFCIENERRRRRSKKLLIAIDFYF
jgi:hypothetical protein